MSHTKSLIEKAQNTIGPGNSDADWKIAPTEHADLFAIEAPSPERPRRDVA